MEKVLLGMSGGVDSSATAVILKEQGFSVTGITLELCTEDNSRNIADARSVCERLGIDHITLDLRNEFREKVINCFIEDYKNGLTPNPCLECNKHIKFGLMLRLALEKGYDKIATGHYARVEREGERFLLKKAAHISKDQSYVLYSLTQHQLSHLLLPLGGLSKTEIRGIAERGGLINANRPDSQDICFVPDGDYAAFIERTDGFVSLKGDYLDINGNILGKHKGIINYTIGQRKGLGIALGKPQFVIEKSAVDNTVILGDEEQLFKNEVLVRDVSFVSGEQLESERSVSAKLRYRHLEQAATIYPIGENRVKILFKEPQRAPSAGQAAVFYEGDTVLGGGIID